MSVTHGTVRGSRGTFDRVDQAKSTRSDDETGFSAIIVYRELWSSWLSSAPKLGSTHPKYRDATLRTRDAAQIEPGFLCEVTLTYRYDRPEEGSDDGRPGGSTPPDGGRLPSPRYEEDVASTSIPIEAHPKYSGLTNSERTKIAKWVASPSEENIPTDLGTLAEELFDYIKTGFRTFIVPSVTETITTYSWGKPSSVSESIGNVSGNWLILTGSIRREGIYWSKTITRQWSASGWPDLYPVNP